MNSDSILQRLRPALRERTRDLASKPIHGQGRHVVYWMHHAVRGHENPALDVAMVAAVVLEVPLLVYQGLGGRHPYDNDRHHTFILEGTRDVRAELMARGIVHAMWLGEDPGQPSPLRALTEDAALVVTEDLPAPPFPRWTRELAKRSPAPVWAVDTACVVPMQLVERQHQRAYEFRRAIRSLLDERLHRDWTEVDEVPEPFDRSRLPFDDIDFDRVSIGELVARCAIDHTVGPVRDTVGGAIAGYARWQAFRDQRLASYAARRNNAADDGASEMSPYLHHGHVSPLRLTREAANLGGKGAEKYLDELIIWRELAHNFCLHRAGDVESLAALPEWAQKSLAACADDPREVLSWEQLARGRTGDRLWDLCQTSLVRQGRLHNNVRMTWGKAIPLWTDTPRRALDMLIDLNHRFALDGSDPNSYGGLLWCLGLFDRPFEPAKPILGTVRSRSLAAHARRLDIERYANRVEPPASGRPLTVAVVGAGISGLACARALADQGHAVKVFEKARGAGGRMSTRRSDAGRFDHGAQYFTARDPRFRRFVDSWRRQGHAQRWEGEVVVLDAGAIRQPRGTAERFVGVPGMSSICRHLAQDLDVRLSIRVGELERSGDQRWRLTSTTSAHLGEFDAVVVSAPAAQTAELVRAPAPALAERAAAAEMTPCWAAMVTFEDALDVQFDAAFVEHSALSWVARNGSKPGRAESDTWVLHATPEWSAEHLELAKDVVAPLLLEAFGQALGGLEATPLHLDAHRWRYALPPEPLDAACLFDADLRLAACGDWCGGPRVEGAFLSGCAAAGRILALALAG